MADSGRSGPSRSEEKERRLSSSRVEVLQPSPSFFPPSTSNLSGNPSNDFPAPPPPGAKNLNTSPSSREGLNGLLELMKSGFRKDKEGRSPLKKVTKTMCKTVLKAVNHLHDALGDPLGLVGQGGKPVSVDVLTEILLNERSRNYMKRRATFFALHALSPSPSPSPEPVAPPCVEVKNSASVPVEPASVAPRVVLPSSIRSPSCPPPPSSPSLSPDRCPPRRSGRLRAKRSRPRSPSPVPNATPTSTSPLESHQPTPPKRLRGLPHRLTYDDSPPKPPSTTPPSPPPPPPPPPNPPPKTTPQEKRTGTTTR